ncbi:MAG TPA: glycine zipper domain-containing protein [Gemmatimonadales bacterium]|jgi:hypothetical protein
MTTTTRYGHLAIALVLLAACSRGEGMDLPDGSTSAAAAAPASYTLSTGTQVDAALTNVISSRQARTGDTFTASVVRDVKSAGGRVAIPAGSQVQGTITDVSPAPNRQSTGTLTLAISSVTVRGQTYPINASIDSLQTITEGRGIEPIDAARVGVGAAAGAILGRVIGGNATGTIIGGVAGGVTGAVVSDIMKDEDIVLPAGSHLSLTLRQRLTVMAR